MVDKGDRGMKKIALLLLGVLSIAGVVIVRENGNAYANIAIWSTPVAISLPGHDAQHPRLATAPAGGVPDFPLLAWEESGQVWFSQSNGNEQWTAPAMLFPGISPVMVTTAAGPSTVAFLQSDSGHLDVFASLRTANWNAPTNVSHTAGTSLEPALAMASDGLHLLWSDTSTGRALLYQAISANGFSWSSAPLTGLYGYYPALVVVPGDKLFLVWQSHDDVSGHERILFSVIQNGSLSTPEVISDNDQANATRPVITWSLAEKVAYIAWQESGSKGSRVMYSIGTPGSWSKPSELSPAGAYLPQIISLPDASLWVAWDQSDRIVVRQRSPQDVWSDPEVVVQNADGAREPTLSVSSADNVTVDLCWQERHSNYWNIFCSQHKLLSGPAPTETPSPAMTEKLYLPVALR